MKLFTILTEDKNRAAIIDIVAREFAGFSVKTQTGYWRGIAEDSLAIEIIELGPDDRSKVIDVARIIKTRNSQEAVYWYETEIKLGVV